MESLYMDLMRGSKTPDKDKSTESGEEDEPMVDETFEEDDDGFNHTGAFKDDNQDQNLIKNLINEEEFRPINHSEQIHIFLKMKPLTQQEMQKQLNVNYFEILSDSGVTVKPPKNSVYSQNKQKLQALKQTVFQFSYVFQPEISQKDFFIASIYPCFEKFFNGDNLLIFSYGVTNSGKTYTMQG